MTYVDFYKWMIFQIWYQCLYFWNKYSRLAEGGISFKFKVDEYYGDLIKGI